MDKPSPVTPTLASFATCLLCHFLRLSPFHCPLKRLWRNGSASDSRSEDGDFESLWPHFSCLPKRHQKPFPWLQTLLPPSTLDNSGGKTCSPTPSQLKQDPGTRTRVARVRAEYPDQLDYSGHAHQISQHPPPLHFLSSFLHNNRKWSHPGLNWRPYGH